MQSMILSIRLRSSIPIIRKIYNLVWKLEDKNFQNCQIFHCLHHKMLVKFKFFTGAKLMIMCKVLEFWSNYWVSKMFSHSLNLFLLKHFSKKIRLNFTIFWVPHHKMQVRFLPKIFWWEIIMFLKLFLEYELQSFE